MLLLCYNRLLGEWLNLQIGKSELTKITARTFHSYLRSLIEQSSYSLEFAERCRSTGQKQIFSELFPFYGELAISEKEALVDTLVVDEAQDLVCPENLAIFSSLVRGGLAGGRWSMFGDFTRQAIYATAGSADGEKNAINMLHEFAPSFPIVPLKVNCRNTRQIGEETALLSGFELLPYRLANVDGLAVDYRYWKNRSEEADQLVKTISMLLAEGVKPNDIVVLAPVRFESSVASTIGGRTSIPVSEFRDVHKANKNCITFSTVHAFKGMESPTVILCDFSDILGDEQRSLLYTGMSRARSHLVVLLSEKTKALMPDLLSKRLQEKWKR